MKKFLVQGLAFALLLPATASLAQQKMDDMKGMDMGKKQAAPSEITHKTVGVVKKVDSKAGTVTLDHDPVKSLNWSAMTMGFKVMDKSLMDKMAEGRKVEVEFKQSGRDYIITSVK